MDQISRIDPQYWTQRVTLYQDIADWVNWHIEMGIEWQSGRELAIAHIEALILGGVPKW